MCLWQFFRWFQGDLWQLFRLFQGDLWQFFDGFRVIYGNYSNGFRVICGNFSDDFRGIYGNYSMKDELNDIFLIGCLSFCRDDFLQQEDGEFGGFFFAL